jgi:uncharacterized protein
LFHRPTYTERAVPRSPRAPHRPEALDVAAFCRDGARLAGEWPLEALPRLAESVQAGADGFAAAVPVRWAVAGQAGASPGGRGEAPRCEIDLDIEAQVGLECQRCLQPMRVPLTVQRRIRFVEGEDEAARLDEELEDDVLALAPRLDLRTLVEDELLLALPLVPRHDTCPQLPGALGALGDAALDRQASAAPAAANAVPVRPENPFAALAKLKQPKR